MLFTLSDALLLPVAGNNGAGGHRLAAAVRNEGNGAARYRTHNDQRQGDQSQKDTASPAALASCSTKSVAPLDLLGNETTQRSPASCATLIRFELDKGRQKKSQRDSPPAVCRTRLLHGRKSIVSAIDHGEPGWEGSSLPGISKADVLILVSEVDCPFRKQSWESSMIRRSEEWGYECVAVDLNTQHDFCDPEGAVRVVNAEELIPALRRVVAWARRNETPVVSSLDSYRATDLAMDRKRRACVDGSVGHEKLTFTIFPRSQRIELDNTLAIPLDLFSRYQQVIFRKRDADLLSNPKADRFLTQLQVRELIVYGNAIERSVKALVLALLTRHKAVTVITDACGFWDRQRADFALRQMEAKGARMITVDELLMRRLERTRRYRSKTLGNGAANGRNAQATGNGRHASTGVRSPRSCRSNGRLSARTNGTTIPRGNGRSPME